MENQLISQIETVIKNHSRTYDLQKFGSDQMITHDQYNHLAKSISTLFDPLLVRLIVLEAEVNAISVEHHTGGYEDRERALSTINELKNFLTL